MVYDADTARLNEIVASDPSFRHVDGDRLAAAAASLKRPQSSLTAFTLAAMHLMALAGNGHSRVIPNGIARVWPLRLVWLEDGPCVVDADERFGHLVGCRLLRVRSHDADAAHEMLRPYLAGTGPRRKVIGAMMLAWPDALQAFGVEASDLMFEDDNGAVASIRPALTNSIGAESLYPVHETGIAHQLIHKGGLTMSEDEARSRNTCTLLPGSPAWYVRLADLVSDESSVLAQGLEAMRLRIKAAPQQSIVVDLRGNPGGDFLSTVDFARHIDDLYAKDGTCIVLVDKFTFSAAIVVAALLKHHARTCRIIGEEMGDTEQFFAEGGTITLAQSGLKVRHSTGYHDWCDGRADPELTPPEIATHMVAAGPLVPDIVTAPTSREFRTGNDPALQAARRLIG